MVVNFVLPVVMKIGEYLVAPVGRQFGYLIFYDRNIKNLEKQVQKLEDKRFGVQKSVEEAEAKREIIAPGVERWLKTVNDLNEEAKKFLEVEVKANKGCLNGWCPNLKSRYSLSRKATKKTQSVEELHGEGVFSTVSYRKGTTFAFTGGFKGFESRRSIMNGVMEALTDDSIYVIGICGMGGVGKTAMVKEVAKKAEEKKMFDKIVMVVVSQSPNLINIQGEIAKILDLQDFGGNNLPTGAEEIRSKILSIGRVLVILDDVWQRLELNDIGIPFGDNHKGCKIVMTSRSEGVCNSMDTQKNFKVGVLNEEEAWNLFKEMAGISDEGTSHPTNLQTQMAVAKECGGLPIAIVTVGGALRYKDKYSWDSALVQLRESKNISGEDKVSKSLELSYVNLESDEAKKCFLLCSLYPEDFDIPIEYLVRYAIGIELFQGIDSVHQVRNRVYSIVDDLKKRCLLMESEEVECIKMHEIVRDVAISIASREEHSFLVRCDEVLKEWPEENRLEKNTVISLKVNGMHWLPGNLEFPNLQLLQLDCNAGLPPLSVHDLNEGMTEKVKVQETPDSLYQGMKELKVLALSDMYSSLPTSLQCLTNLRTLSLFRCRLIDDDISVIRALENLEILSFANSYIKELPKEIIGHLAHLKVLDLWGCVVERIYPGVLSSLSNLEELYVGSSFQSLCRKSREDAKAIIDELASLSNLVALDIALTEITFWPRGLVVEKLKKFNVTVGRLLLSHQPCYLLPNQLVLRHQNVSNIIESRLNLLLKSTEILTISYSGVIGLKILCDLVDQDGFECLTNLLLTELDDLEYLINTADGVPQNAFPVLEFLTLRKLDNFKGITSHECRLPNKAFSALKYVEVGDCHKLESMFSLSIARDLVQLQVLHIHNCDVMEEIVSSEGGEHEIATDKIEFPKLKELFLSDLPSFTAICKAMNAIELPQLSSLSLSNMPKLKRLCPASDSESNCDPQIQPLFNDKVACPALEELLISGVPNITEIWGKQFPSELKVNCFEKLMNAVQSNMRKLSENAKKKAMAQEKKRNDDLIVFPRLRIVRLVNLQNLEIFCRTRRFETQTLFNHQIACPELRELAIGWLPSITDVWDKKLFPTGSFCQLREVRIEGCDKLVNVILSNMLPRLQNLTELSVQYCPMVEEILAEKGEEKADAEAEENIILFPQLKTLELGSLENLKSFCTSRLAAQHFFEHPAAFASLKELHICNLPNITKIWGKQLLPVPKPGAQSFEKLAVLNATWCEKLVNVIPSSMFPRLQNLKSIYVKGCPEMEVIVSKKANATGNGDIILFAQLSSLSIDKLYNLKSFCSSSTSSEAQPLFNDQVAFPVLEDLFINRVRNITKIWDKLPSESFCLLKRMMIEDCEKLVNVVPSSMLPQLRNLKVLSVYSCLKMLAIVSEEEGKEKDVDENTILFPKLTTLNLKSLDNLKTFYTQPFLNYQIALPKLKNPCLDQYLQQQQLLKGKECAIMNENDDKEIEQDKQRLLKGKEFEIMNENDDKETEQDKRRRLKGKEFRNYE